MKTFKQFSEGPKDAAGKSVFVKKIAKSAGVDYKKLILEGADHFSNTLFYHHKISLYENMLAFLGNDCALKEEPPTIAKLDIEDPTLSNSREKPRRHLSTAPYLRSGADGTIIKAARQ